MINYGSLTCQHVGYRTNGFTSISKEDMSEFSLRFCLVLNLHPISSQLNMLTSKPKSQRLKSRLVNASAVWLYIFIRLKNSCSVRNAHVFRTQEG